MYQASYNIDMKKLQEEVDHFLERVSPSDQISVEHLYRAISSLEGTDDKPGLALLDERRRKESYVADLENKLSSKMEASKDRDCSSLSKREVRALMMRHLLGVATKTRNSEFDLLVTLKVGSYEIFTIFF